MNSRPKLLLIGAGGHAKVVIELIRAEARFELVGLVDQNASPREFFGVPVIGQDDDLPRLLQGGITHAHVAIGNNQRREAVGQELVRLGFKLASAISRAANISPSAQLGAGVAIMAGAVVNADSRVGDLAIINTGASVDHDCVIGAGAHIAPGCALAGNVNVGRLAFLGVGTSAIPGRKIGERTVVGAGSCIIRDLPPGALAHGVPARVIRINEPIQERGR